MTQTAPLRILFMGSPEVALPCLESLCRSPHKIVGIVTQPDRPVGRGRKLKPCAVAARARELKLPLYQPENMVNPPFIKTVEELKPDLAVVVAYGRILKQDVIEAPHYKCWNVHFSLLPKYRGAAPYQWALINGETKTGVSLIRLVKKMDAGPILDQVTMAIAPDDDAASLGQKLAPLGAELLMKSLEALQSGTLTETPQDETEVSFAPLLKKGDGLIDWKDSARSLCNRIRGLNPWPVAYTYLPREMAPPWDGGKPIPRGSVDKPLLRIYSAEALDSEKTAAPGTVIQADAKSGLLIACAQGALRVVELQVAGKRRMQATDFLRGHPIPEGICLS